MDRCVSVIIPTYNRAHFLTECLDALLTQTVPVSEIIVVNDGSTDNTEDILQPYMQLIVYLKKNNGGKSTALNLGLKHANGDFVWIFDDDDLSLPHALDIHLKAFDEQPNAGFTYSGYHLGVPDNETGSLKVIETYEAFRGSYKSLFASFACGALHTKIGFMLQQGMLVRKSCYDTVGPFNEGLNRSMDFEMNLRLCRSFKGIRIDKPTFVIRRHEGLRGPSFDRHTDEQREHKWKEYDQKAIRHVCETTPLENYLDLQSKPANTRYWKSVALLCRAKILIKREFYDLAENDLLELRGCANDRELLVDENLFNEIFAIEALIRQKMSSSNESNHLSLLNEIIATICRDKIYRKRMTHYCYWKCLNNLKHVRLRPCARNLLQVVKTLF